MKEKVNQKGFIQIPLLIAIIAGVLVISSAGYFGIKQYRNYQTKQTEKERYAQEQAETQQKILEQAQAEIKKLKQESETAKTKQQELEQKVSNEQEVPQTSDFSISASEINAYIGGVTEVSCTNSEGSGFLMNLDIGYVIVTNDHVIAGNSWCNVLPENSSGETLGHFQLNLASPYEWNSYTDIAILKMSVSPAA